MVLPSSWLIKSSRDLDESQAPATKKAKRTTPPTTFLSLPRELRQAIILDVFHLSYTLEWHVFVGQSTRKHRCGYWFRSCLSDHRMIDAKKIAELMSLHDVGWAYSTWIKTRSEQLTGQWEHDWDDNTPDHCAALEGGVCHGCPRHLQPS